MTVSDLLWIWIWSNGIGLATGLWRWVATLVSGTLALRTRGGPNGAKRLLFARKVVETTVLMVVCLTCFVLAIYAASLPRPTTSAGEARVGAVSLGLTAAVLLISLYNVTAWWLERRIDVWLERQYEAAQARRVPAKWDGETERRAE